jgi:transcriptional regulator of NAD metabolism
MSGEERRGKIIQALKNSDKAVSATTLAKEFDVSRQVIVQDVALLRANGKNIFSTNRGYLIQEDEETTRVFKVQHEDDEVEKELTTIVDLGGTVEDVFVYHKVYGVLRAEMNIKSRMDIRNYMEEIRSGKSSLLKNVTSGYHTVRAERVEILDMIQEELQKKGLLAKLQDYEPVDFWGQNNYNE